MPSSWKHYCVAPVEVGSQILYTSWWQNWALTHLDSLSLFLGISYWYLAQSWLFHLKRNHVRRMSMDLPIRPPPPCPWQAELPLSGRSSFSSPPFSDTYCAPGAVQGLDSGVSWEQDRRKSCSQGPDIRGTGEGVRR